MIAAFWVSKLLAFGVALFCALGLTPLLVWIERKVCAWIQDRVGPNRVGLGILTVVGFKGAEKIRLWGLGQPLADAVKLLSKENIFPDGADKLVFLLAPLFTFLAAFLMYAVIPFGPAMHEGGQVYGFQIADLGVGVLFLLAVGSLSAYGTAFGGWASNSKFSLLGGVRASAQMVSYEIALLLSIVTIILLNSEVSLGGIVQAQSGTTTMFPYFAVPNWNIFTIPGFLAACIFLPCMYAENNRLPFDLAECEAELVGGFHTEYSAMKFAMFMMGEYVAMTALTMLFVTLFLGGYNIPYLVDLDALAKHADGIGMQALVCLLGFGVLFIKSFLFTLLSIQVRWTLPRFRYDQLMKLGWQGLIPAALATLLFAAVWMQWHVTWSASQ